MFVFFFFSSRRRHTRWNCDWSSDVCSSDLRRRARGRELVRERFPRPILPRGAGAPGGRPARLERARSEERRVGKSVDLGGRRINKKKKKNNKRTQSSTWYID